MRTASKFAFALLEEEASLASWTNVAVDTILPTEANLVCKHSIRTKSCKRAELDVLRLTWMHGVLRALSLSSARLWGLST